MQPQAKGGLGPPKAGRCRPFLRASGGIWPCQQHYFRLWPPNARGHISVLPHQLQCFSTATTEGNTDPEVSVWPHRLAPLLSLRSALMGKWAQPGQVRPRQQTGQALEGRPADMCFLPLSPCLSHEAPSLPSQRNMRVQGVCLREASQSINADRIQGILAPGGGEIEAPKGEVVCPRASHCPQENTQRVQKEWNKNVN